MTLRGAIFQIHLWTGLTLGIVLAALGLSGSILVYDQDLMSLGEKPVPQVSSAGAVLSLDALLVAAHAAMPGKHAAVTISPPKPGEPVIVHFQNGRRGPGAGTEVYLDPANGRVLDVRARTPSLFLSFVHRLHGNLLIGGRAGRQVVGWLGLAMLLLGLSGIVIWWPKRGQWSAAFRIRRNARGYRLYRELHGAVGIWGLVVFLIVSFSGVAIAFPQTVRSIVTLGAAQAEPAFDPRNGPKIEPIAHRKPMSVDAAIALVASSNPGKKIDSISIPAKRESAWRVMLGNRDDGPVMVAYVDPWRVRIVATGGASGAADNFMAWQRPLHEGSGWGGVWRFLVFLSGLLPALFVTTGITMWVKKRRSRVRVVQAATLESVDA